MTKLYACRFHHCNCYAPFVHLFNILIRSKFFVLRRVWLLVLCKSLLLALVLDLRFFLFFKPLLKTIREIFIDQFLFSCVDQSSIGYSNKKIIRESLTIVMSLWAWGCVCCPFSCSIYSSSFVLLKTTDHPLSLTRMLCSRAS